jgi:hypothetical protein
VLEPGAVYLMGSIVNDPLNQLGPSATPVIFSDIMILAEGARLERIGSQDLRLFSVADLFVGIRVDGNEIPAGTTGQLSLRNAHIKNFQTQGGDGASGGGGGLGAGGAIYVKDSVLFVYNSTFTPGDQRFLEPRGSQRRRWWFWRWRLSVRAILFPGRRRRGISGMADGRRRPCYTRQRWWRWGTVVRATVVLEELAAAAATFAAALAGAGSLRHNSDAANGTCQGGGGGAAARRNSPSMEIG